MDRMPTEILRLIVLALSKVMDTGEESAVPIMDIKALRLSCRAFADLASEYLFHDIWLYMEEDSFAKLKALTDHPSYGRTVRVLKIFPKLLSDDLLVKEDYETCVRSITFTGDSREKWGFDVEGRRDLSQDQLDAGYIEYTQILEHQVQVRTSAETLLQHALAAFTGLISITTGFIDEIIKDAVCFDRCSKIQNISRKTLMANSCDGSDSPLHHGEDAIMILTAIAASEREGLALNLTNTYGSFDTRLFDTDPSTLEKVKKALASLSRLALSLTDVCPLHLSKIIETGTFANFFEYAANLQYLHLASLPSSPLLFFETVFCKARWSNLKDLSLYGLMVNGDDLNGFIDKHSATLETITLTAMFLMSGNWKKVFTGMWGKRNLHGVAVEDLVVWDDETESRVLGLPASDAINDLLDAFIFEGEESSRELPAGYSQEAKWDGDLPV